MASYNRVVLVGNLTRDVKLEKTPQGTPVTEIGLAVNDRVKKNGEWTDEATFVDITLWGRQAEVAAEYLSKGSPLLVEGRLKLDTWEKDGQKRSKLRVVGERLQMLGGRSGGGGSPRQTGNTAPANQQSTPTHSDSNTGGGSDPFSDDDIPF